MKVEELFPPCALAACPDSSRKHHHVLPKQREVLDSTEQIVCMVGGYGSAKTLVASVLGHLLSTSIPQNRGIVVRRSLPKLHDSTQRIYLEVLDRSGVDVEMREMRDGWPGRIIYPNGSEVVFRETKDLGRFLGPEYGWAYVDEAQEEPEKTFKDLLGRLRLPRAAKHLKLLLATNPPKRGHWLEKRFPKPGSWVETTKVNGEDVRVGFRMVHSRTADNPFLDPEYMARLQLTHSAEELRRILSGEYGVDFDGKPVYRPPFTPGLHVGEFPVEMGTIGRSWDFGFHHPVVTFHQMLRCNRGRVHTRVLREFLREDLLAKDLADKVLEFCKIQFPKHSPHMFLDAGDAAGAATSDKGPGPIIQLAQPPYNMTFRYRHVRDVDPGIREVKQLLQDRCPCGVPLLVVDTSCANVIEMFMGGYRFPRDRAGETKPHAKPLKDGYYDNIADSIRYAIWNFAVPARIDPGLMEDLLKWHGPSEPHERNEAEGFAWLGDWANTQPDSDTLVAAHEEAIMTGRRVVSGRDF